MSRMNINGVWTPADITTEAWYDASDADSITESGGAVSQWNDKSGNDTHLTQATPASQPTTNSRTIGGLNALDFDVDYLQSSVGIVSAPFSYACVVSCDNAGVDDNILDSQDVGSRSALRRRSGGSISMYAGNWLDSAYSAVAETFIISGVNNGVSSELGKNGETPSTGNAGSGGLASGILVGIDTALNVSRAHDGLIGEIIIIAGSWTTEIRQKVEGYLAWKWGLEASLPSDHPYKNFRPLYKETWTPRLINPSAWYDASRADDITESGGAVSQWNDRSGNDRHLTQVTGADQPSTGVNTLNGKNVLSGDGISDHLSIANAPWNDSGDKMIFAVHRSAVGASGNDSVAGNRIVSDGFILRTTSLNYIPSMVGSGGSPSTALTRTDANITMARFDGTTEGARVNGGAEATYVGSGYITSSGELRLFGLPYTTDHEYFEGDIAEVIFTSVLSDSDRQKMEGYLAWKWGLVASLPVDHPYKAEKPTI